MGDGRVLAGGVWRRPPRKKGARLLAAMANASSVCLRFLAQGARCDIVGFGRFLANPRVSLEALIAGWGERASLACRGRHVLAIQDTSEIHFPTTADRLRGLGKIGRGNIHGVLLHARLAVDAEAGGCLGLVSGAVWTRPAKRRIPHRHRDLKDRESDRWLKTAEAAKDVLARAACITVIADRESDIYAEWARLPGPDFHLLTRAMKDRRIVGGKLSTAELRPAGEGLVELRERPGRPARTAELSARYGRVSLIRPAHGGEAGLPARVELTLVEVVERNAPPGAGPVLWRLLTTHAVEDAAAAWRIVGWYRARWTVEQFFRTLKSQGLRLEDSQIEDAGRLVKLTAIAAHAACLVMQLVHARDGKSGQAAGIAFAPEEIETLETLIPRLEGKTAAQKNPHPRRSLAWAAWAIGKLGGWDGYARSKPPGPITLRNGLDRFKSIAQGWSLRDV